MKFERMALLLSSFLALMCITTRADVTPRPLAATSIHNGAGVLYIPSSTPYGNRACYFDDSSTPASSVTTGTELTYLHGVLAPLQGQINALQPAGSYITGLSGDVSASGPGTPTSTVNTVGGSSAANVHSAELAANAATSANTASKIMLRDSFGNVSASTVTAALHGNADTATTAAVADSAASVTGSFGGDVTGTQSAMAISNATVTGKLLTGFSSGAGTISALDSLLTAINKLDGNQQAFIGQKGQPGGLAMLDTNGLVPASELPPLTGGPTFTYSYPKDSSLTSADVEKFVMDDGGVAKVYAQSPGTPGAPTVWTISGAPQVYVPGTPGTDDVQGFATATVITNATEGDTITIDLRPIGLTDVLTATFKNAPASMPDIEIGADGAATMAALQTEISTYLDAKFQLFDNGGGVWQFQTDSRCGVNGVASNGATVVLTPIGTSHLFENLSLTMAGGVDEIDPIPAVQASKITTTYGGGDVFTYGGNWAVGATPEDIADNFVTAFAALSASQFTASRDGSTIVLTATVNGPNTPLSPEPAHYPNGVITNTVIGNDAIPATSTSTWLGILKGIDGGNALIYMPSMTTGIAIGAISASDAVVIVDGTHIMSYINSDPVVAGIARTGASDGSPAVFRTQTE
jgi:hypothetical protein